MNDKVANLGERRAGRRDGKRARACPICGSPVVEAFRPFCSRRCADIDLGRWLKEGYRVPTEEAPENEEAPPPRED